PREPIQMRDHAGSAWQVLASAMLVLFATAALTAPVIAQQDTIATMNDPRVGLDAGAGNTAEVAALHMRLVSYSPKPMEFDSARGLAYINSDLAFDGDVLYQGNFSGFSIWDISNPAKPALLSTTVCATDQGDPSIYGDLLFISAESPRARKDCGTQGVEDGADRMRGVRIFDVSDPRNPQLITNVQTCRGSHTHTIVPHPTDDDVIYIYVGGSSGVRDSTEMAECSDGTVEENPNTAQYRVDIIRVPLQDPEQSAVVGYARIFEDLPRPPGRGGVALSDTATGRGASGPRGCHDLTAYPAFNLVAGSCGSFGILLDTQDPEHPVRLDAQSDVNFSLWHTAVFGNDGESVVFTDEWGGGTSPRCRSTDPLRLGGNTILTIDDGELTQHGYFKMLAAQTETENCVSHNGGLIPVPGRDIMVQGWYQGGVNVFDFTDPNNPIEIAYFDRGPVDAAELVVGGSWGAYWYNGHIYSSELSRGLDVFELVPSEFLSQNEIDAAKLVTIEQYNPQSQPMLEWPAAFPVVRSYLDQLVRNNGLPATRTAAIADALDAAEQATGAARAEQLNALATELDADVASAGDAARVRAMAAAVRDLAEAAQ
ncbi:MAG: LVIVD repeat-containing protein, partial [Longimicrobiales bacterium]